MNNHPHFPGDFLEEPPLDSIAFSFAAARMGTVDPHDYAMLYQSILAYIKASRADTKTAILAAALDAGEVHKVPDKDMNHDVGMPMHDCYMSPISSVFFRAGLLAARELIAAKLHEAFPGSKGITEEVRNWWPTEQLGDDPGTPRLSLFEELVDGGTEGPWTLKANLNPSIEALPEALRFVRRIRGVEDDLLERDEDDEPDL